MSLFSRLFARTCMFSRRNARSQTIRARNRRPLRLEGLEGRQMLTFAAAVDYSVGIDPQAVATADFNGDGWFDVVTANQSSNTVSVLRGNGLGQFAPALHSAAGTSPRSLAVAEFNGDGRPDLLMVSPSDVNVRLLLGNGDGTFQPPRTLAVSLGTPLSVGVGDFNSDLKTDFLLSQDNGDSFGVVDMWLGDGQGGFSWAWNDYLSFPAGELAVADINNDGKLDAVTADLHVLLGNGDGTLTENGFWDVTGSDPNVRAIAIGDLTSDGVPDLVVVGSGVDLLRGRGDGWFDAAIHYPGTGGIQTDVATGDFNGDGKLDVTTSDTLFGTISEWLGTGYGTLAAPTSYAVGSSPAAITVGDLNGDSRPDLTSGNSGSNSVSVLLNNTGGTVTPSLRISDVSVGEGNTGTRAAQFQVVLSAASTQPVTVEYATASVTAAAGTDFQSVNGTITFAPGQTQQSINIAVIGDRLPETNESFVVNLSNSSHATLADGQGSATIVDDEPRISVNDVSKQEGKNGSTTLFIFTVTLLAAYDQPVTMSYRTVDDTAKTSDKDYVAKSGTLTFAPGETTKTITIEVKGDGKKEANETFYLDLFGLSSNSQFTKFRGIGTILSDD